MDTMCKVKRLLFILLTLLPLTASAQECRVRRGDCLPAGPVADGAQHRASVMRRLSRPNTKWDKNKTYKQLVILMSFSDVQFRSENPKETYNNILNKPGYNEMNGPGCMADYFRDQSGGLLNLSFDVYGPYQVNAVAQLPNSDENTKRHGPSEFREATMKFLQENPDIDLSVYDWDGNGYVNQVIYIFAGYTGNQNSAKSYGCIWPSTSTFSTITHNGLKISNYTSSSELWVSGLSCGIGTMSHEFSHSLGLPDIYPVTTDETMPYSMVDEWDLMDGGNFTNYGWCPPNFTSLEKWLLGWQEFTELTESTTISGMKSVADGGVVYQIKHNDNEFLLLENRQWKGWDACLPGQGLVVFHVNYNSSYWTSNAVNSTKNAPRFSIIPADNMNFEAWNDMLVALRDAGKLKNQYRDDNHRHSWYMSSAPYPWSTDSTTFVNDELTSTSTPAATMLTNNSEGKNVLTKPITNIKMTSNGLISFDFMGGSSTDIVTVKSDNQRREVFDLSGRRVETMTNGRVYIVREKDGTIKRVIY